MLDSCSSGESEFGSTTLAEDDSEGLARLLPTTSVMPIIDKPCGLLQMG